MSKIGSLGSVTYYEDAAGVVWVDAGNRMKPVAPEEAQNLRRLGIID